MNLNLYWVMDRKLAGSRGPRSIEDLLFLKNQDIGALVRLVEPNEAWVTEKNVNDSGIEDYNEPVLDFGAPTQAQIDKVVEFIDLHLSQGVAVGVSCNAGIGRTGVILACYLVHKGTSAKEALEIVSQKRGRGPQEEEQIKAVETYWLRQMRSQAE
jgi:atypical dual specificity phosphatase